MIDESVIYDYYFCKYKAYLKYNNNSGLIHRLVQFEQKKIAKKETSVLSEIKSKGKILDLSGKPIQQSYFEDNYDLIENAQFIFNSFCIELNFLNQSRLTSKEPSYCPIFFIPSRKIGKELKLFVTSCHLFISDFSKQISSNSIVYYNGSDSPVRIESNTLRKSAENGLTELSSLVKNQQIPLNLSKTCDLCEYYNYCRKLAKEQDNLSLIRGLSLREIEKLNKKGIFTVNQYSFTFRPRKKRKKNTVFLKKHHHALQALAIRTNKTYIYSTITVPFSKNKIFIDIEYLPEDKHPYLIGIVIVQGKNEISHSIWINDDKEYETKIEYFLKIISAFKEFQIYYYGQTERKFFESILKLDNTRKDIVKRMLDNSINVISLIYGNIYFPTYSNSLKNIANYLGFTWNIKFTTGLDAIYWRRYWLTTGNECEKEKIIQYNIDDCLALKEIVYFIISALKNNTTDYKNISISRNESDDLPSRYGEYEFGSQKFVNEDFEYINECAYFDYQRNKVYIRTNKSLPKPKINRRHTKIPINKIENVNRARVCPRCKSNNLKTAIRRNSKSRIVIDLKFFKGGIKRWNIKYIAKYQNCQNCRNVFFPQKFIDKRGKYGHNLLSWVIYQSVVNYVSYDKIAAMLKDVFQYDYKYNFCDLSKIAFNYYSITSNTLKHQILNGNIIHIDETTVNTRDGKGYVWILSNMNTVYFLFRKDRKTDFLIDLLKDFKGILISDFYKGYDGLDCLHQKCLIHLMRDVNKILFQNQQDESIICLSNNFGKLLRTIIVTIDKFGLKTWHLNKHKKDVNVFYEKLERINTNNSDIQTLINRFFKYRNSLFAFLSFNGVPWNNNNAEHGFTHFAIYRRQAKGLFTEQSIERYLCFLSIYQSCQYRNLSFLHFLRSKEKFVNNYQVKYNKDGNKKALSRIGKGELHP